MPWPIETSDAIGQRPAAQASELLAEDPIGREIRRLEAQRERLFDVVWLANAPVPIKILGSKVAQWLGDSPTGLEDEALSRPPVQQG